MNIFLNQNHELRSGWKFATYAAFFLLIWIATGIAISFVYARTDLPEDPLTFFALNILALFVPAVVALLLAVRFVDHRPLKTFGIGFIPGWQRRLANGLILAAVMLDGLVAGNKHPLNFTVTR